VIRIAMTTPKEIGLKEISDNACSIERISTFWYL
jgi:hypothetical protein